MTTLFIILWIIQLLFIDRWLIKDVMTARRSNRELEERITYLEKKLLL